MGYDYVVMEDESKRTARAYDDRNREIPVKVFDSYGDNLRHIVKALQRRFQP